MKLKEINEKLGGELVGDGEIEIVGINSIENANPDELTFLANPKYARFLETTRAGAVIIGNDVQASGLNLLRMPDPYYAFCQALTIFFSKPADNIEPGTAPTAIIDKTAILGKNVHVGNYVDIGRSTSIGDNSKVMSGTCIGANCRLGSDCLIYPNVTIYNGTVIGDKVTIHSGTVIGSDGYGYATHEGVHHKVYQVGGVRIENNVEIGANSAIDRAAIGETVIGEGTKIDNLVQIAHNVRIGKHCLIVSQAGISGSTILGDYVILAGQVGLTGHIEIGDRAIIGAQSGVAKSLKADTLYTGTPARELMKTRRVEAHIQRLPEKMKKLKELEEEISKLKKQVNHSENE